MSEERSSSYERTSILIANITRLVLRGRKTNDFEPQLRLSYIGTKMQFKYYQGFRKEGAPNKPPITVDCYSQVLSTICEQIIDNINNGKNSSFSWMLNEKPFQINVYLTEPCWRVKVLTQEVGVEEALEFILTDETLSGYNGDTEISRLDLSTLYAARYFKELQNACSGVANTIEANQLVSYLPPKQNI